MKLYHLFTMWLVGIVLGVNLTTMILLPILSHPDHLNGLEVPPRRVEVVEKTVIQEEKKVCLFPYSYLVKYSNLDECLRRASLKVGDNTKFLHNCLLQAKIENVIINGEKGGMEWSWISIYVEPLSGFFVYPDGSYEQ